MRAVLAVIVWVTVSIASVLHVPQDYSSIQMALDSLANQDTVLVAAGYYPESLQAPENVSFVMVGLVNPGGNPEEPVIDPSPLEGATHLSCLSLPAGSQADIHNITFRNGAAMYPRQHGTDAGGIRHDGASLTVTHCRFDSTYKGVYCGVWTQGTLTVSDCEFVNNVQGCIEDDSPSRTVVVNSDFSGRGDVLAWFSDSAWVENCTFHDVPYGAEWLWLTGQGITVRGCDFGPTTMPMYDIIWTQTTFGCVIENNVFHDLDVTGAVIFFNAAFADTACFRGNEFRNVHGLTAANAGSGIAMSATGFVNPRAVVEACDFDSCFGGTQGFGALRLWSTDAVCTTNRFRGPEALTPMVRVIGEHNNVIMHENLFDHTGWALWSDGPLNAEHNWWGDSTGPYHATLNPAGLGDSISGPVDFIPWWTDSILTAPTQPAPLPETVSLFIYPNPFNSTTTLKLEVKQPGIFKVDLYNLLGQHVEQIWSGAVAYQQTIPLYGDNLPSGIYYVRAFDPIGNRPMALQKVVLLS